MTQEGTLGEFRIDSRIGELPPFPSGQEEFRVAAPGFVALGATLKDQAVYDVAKLPDGTQVACVRTPTGHNTEVAIPVSYLNERQNGHWKHFRMNITVADADAPCPWVQHQLWWKPDWRSEEDYAGSGTFERR